MSLNEISSTFFAAFGLGEEFTGSFGGGQCLNYLGEYLWSLFFIINPFNVC